MKIGHYLVMALLSATAFSSCKKDDGISPEYTKKADEFKAFIQSKQFQIADYYSDKEIDYVEDDDTVKAEKELWKYVSGWLKDDHNVFDVSTGKVTITQNEIKMPGITDEVFTKDFSIGADKDGPYFNFLTHEYNPLKYRLVEFSGDHFIVYVNWHSGGKVFTRFNVVQ